MKRTKIIYGDGVVERQVCADTQQAFVYAREQARLRGTYVRSQSAITGTALIDAAVYHPASAKKTTGEAATSSDGK